MNSSMWHACLAPGCRELCATEKLMCPAHWTELNGSTRAAVNASWRAWRSAVDNDEPDVVELFRAYMKVRREAIAEIEALHV